MPKRDDSEITNLLRDLEISKATDGNGTRVPRNSRGDGCWPRTPMARQVAKAVEAVQNPGNKRIVTADGTVIGYQWVTDGRPNLRVEYKEAEFVTYVSERLPSLFDEWVAGGKSPAR